MMRILLVDDEHAIHSAVSRLFRKDDITFFSVFDGNEALEVLKKDDFDVLITDIKMPRMDGIQLLERIKDKYPKLIRLILTGYGTIDVAVKAMKLGADGFLEKTVGHEGFRRQLIQEVRSTDLKRENRQSGELPDPAFSYAPLQGLSGCMDELKRMILRVAASNVNVLIQGETGTGKELVAKAIHHHSIRKDKYFIPVNCSSLNETLFESELFGHERGAFTGAYTSYQGIIRTAHEGTLFLDEIGELSKHLQVKLLRTIQERTVRPVGSTKSYPVDIRIITATNQDLSQEVSNNNFREDLFYRLNVITVEVPPLRERKSDIPLLVRYFIENSESCFSPVHSIDDEAMTILREYSWPGNVRELENIITRAVVLGNSATIGVSDLPYHILNSREDAEIDEGREPEGIRDVEMIAIRKALKKYGGDKKTAAAALGIGITTLYRKIKRYHLSED